MNYEKFKLILKLFFHIKGPACDELCSPAGLLAAKLNKPVLSYSCASSVLDSRTKYPTVARTSVDYAGIGNFVYDILHHFHWTRVILVQGHEDIWRETVQYYQVLYYFFYHSKGGTSLVRN